MFQPNEFLRPRHREIPNILEKICWNLSKAFLEKYACSFELCLPSFTMQPVNHDQRRSRADNEAAALASLAGFAPFVVTARLMAGLDFDEAAKRAPNLRQTFDLIAKPSLVESFDRENPAIREQPFVSPLAWAYYSAYSAIMTSAFVTARALAEGLEDAGIRLDLKTTKPVRQIDEAVLKQAPAIRLSSRRSYVGVQTMNKQSDDKIASLQNEPNELNPAKGRTQRARPQ